MVKRFSLNSASRRSISVNSTRFSGLLSRARASATADSWGGDQIEFLASRPSADYETWIMSEPDDLASKIKALNNRSRTIINARAEHSTTSERGTRTLPTNPPRRAMKRRQKRSPVSGHHRSAY